MWINHECFHLIGIHEWHKYLGRHLSFSYKQRACMEIKHRIAAAWYQFHKKAHIFKNKDLSVKKKLKLFDAYVTPSALYGLSAIALNKSSLNGMGSIQRKILRYIVGWTRIPEEPWDVTMRRMKHKVNRALRDTPIQIWPETILKRK